MKYVPFFTEFPFSIDAADDVVLVLVVLVLLLLLLVTAAGVGTDGIQCAADVILPNVALPGYHGVGLGQFCPLRIRSLSYTTSAVCACG